MLKKSYQSRVRVRGNSNGKNKNKIQTIFKNKVTKNKISYQPRVRIRA